MRDEINVLADYAERLSGPVPGYLDAIERETYLRTVAPQMITGRLQGRILALLSKLIRPRLILEIGTFTGYGSLCLAEGLRAGGKVYTVEGDPEMARRARRNFDRTPLAARIEIVEGNAESTLRGLEGPFDIIYLDADKRAYPDYFPRLKQLLASGGLLLTDNVCWDGKMVDGRRDPVAESIRAFNELLLEDSDMEVVLLPLRDGLSVARKTK